MDTDSFQPAFAANLNELVTDFTARITAVAYGKPGKWHEGRGDRNFIARQHAYFLLAVRDCRCSDHTCNACRVCLGVAKALEPELQHLDPRAVDREQAFATAVHERQAEEHANDLLQVQRRVAAAEARKKREQAALRQDHDQEPSTE